MKFSRITQRVNRARRVRAKISGTATRPRLSVFRGTGSMYLQLIDDLAGVTLASATEKELSADISKGTKTARATGLGALIAKKASEKGISSVVFDRGGNAYHGRVKAAADAAREGGLVF